MTTKGKPGWAAPHEAVDLNQVGVWNRDDGTERFRETTAAASADGAASVYFAGIEERLIELIQSADAVFGCVAWLTSEPILRALAMRRNVAIVVQKEDFLRPDLGASGNWSARLRELYEALSCELSRYDFDNRVGTLNYCGDPRLAPVRCAGLANQHGAAAWPRMHHKFLVFADVREPVKPYREWHVRPHTVWTGSFNLTRNAGHSLENAVVLRDPAIVGAYFEEWAHVESISEPLDWQTEWAAPEWWIGS